MSIRVEFDDTDVRVYIDGVTQEIRDQAALALTEAANTIILPRAQARSISVWKIRTGHYGASWYATPISAYTVEVGNTAEYAAPLEYGWTTKGGTKVASPGVLFPVVEESVEDVRSAIESWVSLLLRR